MLLTKSSERNEEPRGAERREEEAEDGGRWCDPSQTRRLITALQAR